MSLVSVADRFDRILFGQKGCAVLSQIGRLAIAGLFLDAARYHVSHEGWIKTVSDMTARGVPYPTFALAPAMVVSSLLALALAIGFKTRYVALALALYTACVSLVMYNPFAGLGVGALVLLLKDMAVFGGLVALAGESARNRLKEKKVEVVYS